MINYSKTHKGNHGCFRWSYEDVPTRRFDIHHGVVDVVFHETQETRNRILRYAGHVSIHSSIR